ncbi:MAG: hypothetical protein CVV28_01040 [Methanobacteriales archaeon HGW-Methanobacteriales-1]|jgi:hypothetical protein|nr:MAG: hypothetical protein CVV28_01040 [Methanobacteriales archaeon HGW-Methanobacteriales-1]
MQMFILDFKVLEGNVLLMINLSIKKIGELKIWLDKNGIELDQISLWPNIIIQQSPGFLRKNEIIVKI